MEPHETFTVTRYERRAIARLSGRGTGRSVPRSFQDPYPSIIAMPRSTLLHELLDSVRMQGLTLSSDQLAMVRPLVCARHLVQTQRGWLLRLRCARCGAYELHAVLSTMHRHGKGVPLGTMYWTGDTAAARELVGLSAEPTRPLGYPE